MIDTGASVAEWLESPTSNYLPLTAVGSIPGQTGSKIFHVRKPSSWLTVGRWFYPGARSGMNNARRGTWGLPPPSKLEKSPYDLSCVGVTINQTKKKRNDMEFKNHGNVLLPLSRMFCNSISLKIFR